MEGSKIYICSYKYEVRSLPQFYMNKSGVSKNWPLNCFKIV